LPAKDGGLPLRARSAILGVEWSESSDGRKSLADRDNASGRTQLALPSARRSRWYAWYCLLAAFTIVGILAGTLLNYQLAGQYQEANRQNRYWSGHLGDYAELGTLLSAANAPGNNVFVSHDARREGRRLDVALAALTRKLTDMRRNHESAATGMLSEDRSVLTGEIEKLATKMGGQARKLLLHYAAGAVSDALRDMAILNQTHAEVMEIVNRLEAEARTQQSMSLDEQVRLASTMRNVQYVMGLLIALLVLGAVAYGYRSTLVASRLDAERIASEAALMASERRFRELTEGSIQGIVVHRDGNPLFVNHAWARIHGYDGAGDVGALDDIAELVAPEDRKLVRNIRDTLQSGASRQYEYRATRRDGKTIWLECRERAIDWQGGPALQSTVIDVTARKETESSLRDDTPQARQATNTSTRFFAAASHDLRQPLHAISLYLPLLLKRVDDRDGREMLKAIQNSCDAMRNLLDSLLDISRLDAGEIAPRTGPVPLLDLFDQLGMEFAPRAAAKGLEMRVVPADYWVQSDAALLTRMLRSLLTNAIGYTESGKILLGARRVGDEIRIEVRDTGIGIAKEKLERIFEDFYQADDPELDRGRGLGLGLAIVDRLARLLKHDLSVRSARGKGSVFGVTMPRTQEAPATMSNARNLDRPRGDLDGRVVLLIEDDPLVLEGNEAMLEDWGCSSVGAASISEAVRAVGDKGVVPDVILADFHLRGKETGPEAVAAVNELLLQPVNAIILTGDTDLGRIEQASASGLFVLHKPVEPERLRAAILEAIRTELAEAPDEVGQGEAR